MMEGIVPVSPIPPLRSENDDYVLPELSHF